MESVSRESEINISVVKHDFVDYGLGGQHVKSHENDRC